MPSRASSAAIRAQSELQANTADAVEAAAAIAWSQFMVASDIDAGTEDWMAFMLPAIERSWNENQMNALLFYQLIRSLELPRAEPIHPDSIDFDPTRARKALEIVGPIAFKERIKAGMDPDEAFELGETTTAGAAVRQALAGGRDGTVEAMRADPVALGFRRETRADPCYFCALIASRGPVYTKETADFEAHDHDRCYPVPVFKREKLGTKEQHWDGIYQRAQTEQRQGENILNTFRRLYDEDRVQ